VAAVATLQALLLLLLLLRTVGRCWHAAAAALVVI
jgi:hypothetical protein